jgi:uncharacterized protein YlxW (UPF0749 family)
MFRQDLLGRETELVQAFRETEEGLKQLGEVDAGRLDAPLEMAHQLLQHLENQQPRVNALQSEIGQLQATCTAEESRLLDNKSKELDETTKVLSMAFFSLSSESFVKLLFQFFCRVWCQNSLERTNV